jgi:hypothetical protein
MRIASPDVITARRCGSEKRLPSGSGRHQDRGMPGIIPSVEAALYKMNVNGAADEALASSGYLRDWVRGFHAMIKKT